MPVVLLKLCSNKTLVFSLVLLQHPCFDSQNFSEYFTDLEGRNDQDPTLPWDFYGSSLFGEKPWKDLPTYQPV